MYERKRRWNTSVEFKRLIKCFYLSPPKFFVFLFLWCGGRFFFVFVLNACVVDGGVVETTLTGSNRRRLMRRWYKTEQTRRRQKEVKGRIQRKTIEIIRKQTNKEVVTVHALRWMATTYYLWFNQFLCVWFLQIMTTKRLRAMNHLTFCFFFQRGRKSNAEGQ